MSSKQTALKSTDNSYWKLSSFYGFYFAILGALVPFLGLYLDFLGFESREIGELLAIIMGTKIIAPNIWGWIVDKTSKRLFFIRLAAVLSAFFFLGIFISHQYWWLFVVLFLFSFFWNAIIAQLEALTLNHLGDDHHRYSLIRLWGSIGFIVTVLGLGWVFNHISLAYFPYFILALIVGIIITAYLVDEKDPPPHHSEHEPLFSLLKRPEIIALFVVCFLVQLSHGPYYSFFSIYASEHDYSKAYIGFLWALGVMSEVLVFIFIPRWVERIGLRKLLLFSLFSGALRWLVIGYFIHIPWLLTINQIFHASTFGIYHVVVISLVHRYFVGKNQGMGQSLYSSISFGLGGAVGSLYAGYVWDGLGPEIMYSVAAAVSFIALLISFKYTHDK